MSRPRPTAVLVLAILHLVGGGIGLIISLCACGGLLMGSMASSFPMPTAPARPGGQPAPPPPNPGQIMKYYDDHVPGYRAFTIGAAGASMLLDVMLLAGGVGLLNMQSWGRVLSLIYAPISIIVRIVGFVYQLVLVMPATKDLYAQNPALSQMSTVLSISTGLGLFFGLLFVLYPICVLIILLKPSTAAAFRGEGLAREESTGEGDSYPDDPWQ